MWFRSNLANIAATDNVLVADTLSLLDAVDALAASGALNRGQANALPSKLHNVVGRLESGRDRAALNQLDAFLNQVQAFQRARVLTSAQGEALLDVAELIVLTHAG